MEILSQASSVFEQNLNKFMLSMTFKASLSKDDSKLQLTKRKGKGRNFSFPLSLI